MTYEDRNLPIGQKPKTKHPHAEMIAEAVMDTRRKIECSVNGAFFRASNILEMAHADDSRYFRFADTVSPVVVSSLSDDELCDVCQGLGAGNPRRAIADAAAQREREDICKLYVTAFIGNVAIQRFIDDLAARKI